MAHISYTMCIHGLPDMYTLSPRACGPQASGVHIRQTTHAHDITIYNMTSKDQAPLYDSSYHVSCLFQAVQQQDSSAIKENLIYLPGS